jgi:hypothetical protein
VALRFFFLFLLIFLRLLAGGSPAASHLFCFAKKGNPKKATPAIAETPKNWVKNGKKTKLACGSDKVFS